MAFKGWPAEAFEFYERLELDNSKEYWQAHKDVYERAVRAPFEALFEDLAPQYGAGRLFRPYRDVRFSKDKSPYKTNAAATLERGGYISLSANGVGAGCGYYEMAADQLDRYRRAVDDDTTGKEIERMVASMRKKGIEVDGHGELKTAPRGYAKDHPRIELLRYKGLISWQSWPPSALLSTPKIKTKIVEHFRASEPLVGWLDDHVGPSTAAPERGGR